MKKKPSSKPTLILSLSFLLQSLALLPTLGARPKCNANDRKVLLEIKAALNNPYAAVSWTPELDCCHWIGVDCDETTGRVISINISYDNVSGQIPPAVGDLPYLQEIIFRKLPNLVGQIPSSITKLTHLRSLWLSWTNLSGPVPSFISQMKNLNYINLSFNNLTGSIPPSLSQLPKLEALFLDRNKLTGSIPESFGHWAGTTPDLYLSHNMLSGPVPKSLGNLNVSLWIDLSRNKLEGDASFLFGKSKTVQLIDLSRNEFQFDISRVEFSTKVIHLDLNHNKIYGSLPRQLTQLALQTFNVSYNRLCGEIPQGGRLQEYDMYSYFHNKCLCGAPLPPCN